MNCADHPAYRFVFEKMMLDVSGTSQMSLITVLKAGPVFFQQSVFR
jgi:hypothetical protein